MRRRTLIATALIGTIMSQTADAQEPMDPENTLYMDLKDGRVVIRLRPDLAPKHVERVKALARKHFYDGTPFHRVIDGFMAQGGDPTGTGTPHTGAGRERGGKPVRWPLPTPRGSHRGRGHAKRALDA